MKTYNICGLLLLGALTLGACSEETTYDIDGSAANLLFLDTDTPRLTETTLYHTPAGEFGGLTVELPAKLQYAATATVRVAAEADNNLVAAYNTEHKTSYEPLPAAVASALAVTGAAINVGEQKAAEPATVQIPESVRAQLTAPEYLLPVRLRLAEAPAAGENRPVALSADESNLVQYLVIHTQQADKFVSLTGSKTATCAIVVTPVGTFGGLDAKFTFGIPTEIDADIQLTAEADNSLVAQWNADNGKDAKALPASVLSALTAAGSIAKGEKQGTLSVSAPLEACKALTEPLYVLPVRMTATYANGNKTQIDDVAYITVQRKESLLQEKPTEMFGHAATGEDKAAWKCISADGFDASAMNPDRWTPSKQEKAEFVIDLGRERAFTGFWLNFSLATAKRLYISKDNATWTLLDTDGAGTYRQSWSVQWYLLYGTISTRYVKVEADLDVDSWYWEYANWGYCDASFNFAFND